MTPKVSIILANYNEEKYIAEAIESVINQTYTNWELIIIDDASTDRSQDIINSYKDSRIKTRFCKKNNHVAYASNLGIDMAIGEYIAKIDSDDVWEAEKLEKQVLFMEEHTEYGVCFSKVNIIDEDSKEANTKFSDIFELFDNVKNRSQEEWIKYFLKNGNCLCNASAVIRKAALECVGGHYNLAFVGAEDYELWMRLIIKFPIYIMDERLVRYRWEEAAGKISGFSLGKIYVTFNLQTMVKSKMFDYMSDEEFKKFFGNEFVNKTADTAEEIECEKAEFMLRCTGKDVNFLGLLRYEKLLEQPEILEILQKKSGFSLPEFYKELRVRNFGIPGEIEAKDATIEDLRGLVQEKEESIQRQKLVLEKDIADRDNKIKELEAIIEDYENSTSWKLTKPLRKIGTIVKK